MLREIYDKLIDRIARVLVYPLERLNDTIDERARQREEAADWDVSPTLALLTGAALGVLAVLLAVAAAR